MEREPFIVDLNDPADMAAKLNEAKQILARHEARLLEVRRIEQAVAEWQANVAFLASRVPEVASDDEHRAETPQPSAAQSSPPIDTSARQGANNGVGVLAVEVVNREPRPIQSKTVTAILRAEGQDVTPTMVSNALHYAARKNKIQALPGRGVYAPHSYRETVIFDSANGHESTSLTTNGRTAPDV